MFTTYEAWSSPDGSEIIFTSSESITTHRVACLVGIDWMMLHSIEAGSWNEAMVLHHRMMGWEPYKPF